MDNRTKTKATSAEETNDYTDSLTNGVTTNDKVIEGYVKWSKTYEQDLSLIEYNGYKYAAKAVDTLLCNEKATAKILDCGAGTGLLGQNLQDYGFKYIDALDACQEMLDIAREKEIYNNFICDYMGKNRLPIDDNTYDAITCASTFCPGHANGDCLPELIRVVKPGGYIVIAMREEFLMDADDFKDKLEPDMATLQKDGRWRRVSRYQVPNFYDNFTGIVFIYQVSTPGSTPAKD